jgi:tRNA(adenine34) deaminase
MDLMIMHRLDDSSLMRKALEEAKKAASEGDVPVGAVLIVDGRIFKGHNRVIKDSDPTAHAELVVLREASRTVGNYRIPEASLIVTLEPCLMCAGAIVHARIARLVFGARDERYGAVGSLVNAFALGLNHRPEVIPGVLEEECGTLLKAFFQVRR